MKNFFLNLILGLLVSGFSLAQSTIEMDEFNAAYFQYGEAKDTKPDVAREAARRAYEMGKALFGAESERSAMLAVNYATLLENETDARYYLDEAVETYQSVFGFDSERMIDPLISLGSRLSDREKFDLSEEYYLRALQLTERHFGLDSSKAGYIELEIGALQLRIGRLDASWEHLQKARQTLARYSDVGSGSGLTRAYLLIGEYHLARQNYRGAIDPLLLSLRDFNTYPSADITVRNHVDLIKAYENLNESDSATGHCLAIGATRRLSQDENLRPVFRAPVWGISQKSSGDPIRVHFTVDKEGYVVDPQVPEEIAQTDLRDALIASIMRFRFAPRFEDGEAVESPNQYYDFH